MFGSVTFSQQISAQGEVAQDPVSQCVMYLACCSVLRVVILVSFSSVDSSQRSGTILTVFFQVPQNSTMFPLFPIDCSNCEIYLN